MVNKQKPGMVVNGARFGVKAGSLLLGITFLASCSMFAEETPGMPENAADAGAARIDPQAPGIVDGLPGDTVNQRHDGSMGRRPVTTVRPLEEELSRVEAPEPVAQTAAAPPTEAAPPIEAAPVEPVPAAKAPEPAPAPVPAPAPAPVVAAVPEPVEEPPQEKVEATTPPPAPRVASAEQNTVLVSRSGSDAEMERVAAAAEAPVKEPAPEAAPVEAPRRMLVADTGALDRAAAQAYGGVAAQPPMARSTHPAALVPVSGGRGGVVQAGGPVVIGGSVAGGVTPAVSGGNGPVVIGGSSGGMVPAVMGGQGNGAGVMRGGDAVAVIQFPFGSSALGSRDRSVLRQVADIQARQGGFIKVVGHSSQFTENMPQDRHMLVNFTTSVARAEAVARALRDEGVPPEVIDVSAVGDREPLYLEVMPSGEAGNRRVEIFLVR